jgi:hypothetical protein
MQVGQASLASPQFQCASFVLCRLYLFVNVLYQVAGAHARARKPSVLIPIFQIPSVHAVGFPLTFFSMAGCVRIKLLISDF